MLMWGSLLDLLLFRMLIICAMTLYIYKLGRNQGYQFKDAKQKEQRMKEMIKAAIQESY
jgi:hypothetical protein